MSAGLIFIAHLKDTKQLFGQIVSILFVAGHFVLFTYLTSYASSKGFGGPEWETLLYTVFGLSGISGGILAGTLSDLFGRRVALLTIPFIYIVATLLLAFSESSISFFSSIALWACASWSISPVVQSYLIDLERSPKDIIIGANTTAMHLGVAVGVTVGGALLDNNNISILPVGTISLVILAFIFALLSIWFTHNQKMSRCRVA